MDISEIDQRLNEMWKRLHRPETPGGEARAAASGLDMAAAERDLLRATLAELRRNFEREKERWRALVEQRDETARALAEEKKWLEEDAARVRKELEAARADFQSERELQGIEKAEFEAELSRRTHGHRDEIELRDRQLRDLETAHRGEVQRLQESLEGWRQEEKAWYVMLEKKNHELAELGARLNQLGLERQKDRAAIEEQKRAAEAAVKEKTAQLSEEKRVLSELAETRAAEIANFQRMLNLSQQEIVEFTRNQHHLETELRGGQEQALRLQSEIQAMREAWEVERGHWRELWERERASRERWYDDMRGWEDHLREEREDWLKQFRAASDEVPAAAVPSLPAPRPAVDPFARPPLTPMQKRRRSLALGVGAAAALSLAVAAAAVVRSAFPKEFAAPGERFSGLAAHGPHLYFANWMTGQIVQSAAGRPAELLHHGAPDPTFHPVSLRWAEEKLWALDPWSRTLQEHQGLAPFTAMSRWVIPEENALDLAWDGQGFWILDGGTVLRRHVRGALDTVDREIALPSGWRLSALDARDGEFWGYDEAAGLLRRFRLGETSVESVSEAPLPVHARPASPLTALALSRTGLWSMSEKSVTLHRWSSLAVRLAKLFS